MAKTLLQIVLFIYIRNILFNYARNRILNANINSVRLKIVRFFIHQEDNTNAIDSYEKVPNLLDCIYNTID